ncbi:hypothetical protein AMK26_23660 [Streptomyces sp. CB03234]|nr:hypothetical protein AMK26_23660 [Streptomyces sp. CB03234]
MWQAEQDDAEGRTLLILGGDRPIGTFLRAHEATDTRLLVVYPESDDYKVEEIYNDPRVTLLSMEHLTLHAAEGTATTAEVLGRGGERQTITAGRRLPQHRQRFCRPCRRRHPQCDRLLPPVGTAPRVIVAGDLRSARFQRIMTAMGFGQRSRLARLLRRLGSVRAWWGMRTCVPPWREAISLHQTD